MRNTSPARQRTSAATAHPLAPPTAAAAMRNAVVAGLATYSTRVFSRSTAHQSATAATAARAKRTTIGGR
jgi:hypothetical protein